MKAPSKSAAILLTLASSVANLQASNNAPESTLNIHTACTLARIYAKHSIAGAVRLLVSCGVALNLAARYVFAALRAQRA